jgi:serine/threonine-protein kinase RsbW
VTPVALSSHPHPRPHSRWHRPPHRATTIFAEAAVKPEMELTLPARAGSLAIVRDALRALGRLLGIDEQKLADICLAVTEACTNVVVHAYPEGSDGPLDVIVWLERPQMAVAQVIGAPAGASDVFADAATQTAESALAGKAGEPAEQELTVIVRDCGSGTDTPAANPGLGLGLRLIASLAKSARVTSDVDMRTEVEMTFSLTSSPTRAPAGAPAAASAPDPSTISDAAAALAPRVERDSP